MADDNKNPQEDNLQEDQNGQNQQDQQFNHDINMNSDEDMTPQGYAEKAKEQGAMDEEEAAELEEGVK